MDQDKDQKDAEIVVDALIKDGMGHIEECASFHAYIEGLPEEAVEGEVRVYCAAMRKSGVMALLSMAKIGYSHVGPKSLMITAVEFCRLKYKGRWKTGLTMNVAVYPYPPGADQKAPLVGCNTIGFDVTPLRSEPDADSRADVVARAKRLGVATITSA